MLSITLAASLLQLAHTPWLDRSWHKGNIVFLRAKDKSLRLADVQHPYLTLQHTSKQVDTDRNALGHDSSKLLALGVMLVEICSGEPIEGLQQLGDAGTDTASE
jgi:hypothetical protein